MIIKGKLMYSGSNDRTVREWDIEQGICKRTFDKNENWITSIFVTDHLLICSGYEQNINIYDLKSGNKLRSLKGHQKRVVGLVVGENGILYSASIDGVIRFWDLDSGECLKMHHCKESIFAIDLIDNLLFCTLYSEIFVLDPDSDSKVAPYLGISNFYFCLDSNLLCGWDRNTSSFVFVDIKSHNTVYAIKNDLMFHTSSVVFEKSNLYYINGTSIAQQKVSIDKRVSIKITSGEPPSYLKYQELLSYYTNVLLYPIERVHDTIQSYEKKLSDCKTLDDQINMLKKSFPEEIVQNFEFVISKQDSDKPIYSELDFALDFESRTDLFYTKIREMIITNNQPTVILVRRDHLVYDTCKHFSILKRQDFLKPMYIFFQGEQGLDVGGVTREFYQLLSEQILDPRNCLFVKSGFNYTYHPNPNSSVNEAHLQYFTFVGKLIGKAILDMQMMETHFTPVLFKLILGRSIHFSDLEFVDPSLFLGMNKLLQLEDASVMDFNFVTEENDFGMNNTYALIENGEKILVTEENKLKFVELYSRWKLIDSCKPQIERILSGVYEIIPQSYFKIFDEKELELLLCGSPEISVEDWKRNTKLDGFDEESSKVVDLFWEMCNELTFIERSKLLQFATGTACIPNEGFEGIYPNFTLCRLRKDESYLPVAHTCLNRLDLPDYKSLDTMKTRFKRSIEFGLKEGFQLH